jgi:hypothetical protein
MATRVALQDVVEALELAHEEASSHVHATTGRVVTISHETMQLAEGGETSGLPEWQKDELATALDVLESDSWLKLPSKFDLREWGIMDEFARGLPDDRARGELLDAIRGRGAFRNFEATIRRLGIEDAWYAHKARTIERIAREWISEHGLAIEDTARPDVAVERRPGGN